MCRFVPSYQWYRTLSTVTSSAKLNGSGRRHLPKTPVYIEMATVGFFTWILKVLSILILIKIKQEWECIHSRTHRIAVAHFSPLYWQMLWNFSTQYCFFLSSVLLFCSLSKVFSLFSRTNKSCVLRKNNEFCTTPYQTLTSAVCLSSSFTVLLFYQKRGERSVCLTRFSLTSMLCYIQILIDELQIFFYIVIFIYEVFLGIGFSHRLRLYICFHFLYFTVLWSFSSHYVMDFYWFLNLQEKMLVIVF